MLISYEPNLLDGTGPYDLIDSEFVLFLDDDIRLHRSTIGTLVVSMDDPRTFLSNGFPFDLPGESGSFANYLTMVYHMAGLVRIMRSHLIRLL